MNKPVKYFRICYFDHANTIRPFETHQFVDKENNWFETEAQAEEFIQEHFLDSDQESGRSVDVTLIVLPIYTVQFKRG